MSVTLLKRGWLWTQQNLNIESQIGFVRNQSLLYMALYIQYIYLPIFWKNLGNKINFPFFNANWALHLNSYTHTSLYRWALQQYCITILCITVSFLKSTFTFFLLWFFPSPIQNCFGFFLSFVKRTTQTPSPSPNRFVLEQDTKR